jgi:osmoprotectant transport system substrate-binding protein
MRREKTVNYIKHMLAQISFAGILILVVLLAGCSPGKEGAREAEYVTVGAKHFTEQELLGELMAILIEENTDIRVVRKLNLGGTMVCFNALRTGDIDLYAEYTGTGLVNILHRNALEEPEDVYQTVKKAFREQFNLAWLEPFGFNNTYTLTMRKSHAASLGIKSISDIISFRDRLVPGFDAEFLERPDGYQGLVRHYGFEFGSRPRQMDPGLMYKALAEGAVDVIDGFATDGRIRAYDLLILTDDKHFFPPYYAAPLIRKETVTKYPEITALLNSLAGTINNETMQKLNYQVDKEERSPSDVAREFLASKGLLPQKT